MIDQQREELLAKLHELSERYPSMRLGQMIANLASWASDEPDIWDATDEELLEAAQSHLAQCENAIAKQ